MIRFLSRQSLFIVGLAACPCLQAMPQAGASVSQTSYVFGSEDQISIHVVDMEELSDKPVRIDPNGFIELPMLGRIQAAGLSVEQLRAVLAAKLAKYIDSPQITINILDYRSRPVSILGEVNTPGVHQVADRKRLIDVISLAGGLKPDAGEKITITRQIRWGMLPVSGAHLDSSGNFSIADIDVSTLTGGQNPVDNIEVRANDVISVSRANLIYVVGEVKKAGGYSLNSRQSISLIRALSLAEGLGPNAAPKKALILHDSDGAPAKGDGVPVDLHQILAGKAPDVQLRANDVLFIPNNASGSAMKRAAEAAIQIATGVIIFHP